ncbi:MAG TPA: hypothetical protein VD858_01250 [Reyranella sp.]|nr:hypothetical protein [Reyranella sp.]
MIANGCLKVDGDRVARRETVGKGLVEQLLQMVPLPVEGRRPLAFSLCAHRHSPLLTQQDLLFRRSVDLISVGLALLRRNVGKKGARIVRRRYCVGPTIARSADDMSIQQENRTIREAVGVFHSAEQLQAAIDELLQSGFHRAELSLLASERAVDQKLSHRYRKVSTLADDPVIPRAAYVSPEAIGGAEGGLIGVLMYVGAVAAAGAIVASGGTLTAAILGAALTGGAGGLIGSLLARWVGESHGRHLQEQVDRGGLLLWVRTWDNGDEQRATRILESHSGTHVHIHALPAVI